MIIPIALVVLVPLSFLISRDFIAGLKIIFTFGLAAILLGGIWIFALGSGSAVFIAVAVALSLFIAWIVVLLARGSIIVARARNHPERYVIPGVSCAICQMPLIKAPVFPTEKEPYAHLMRPDSPHTIRAVDQDPIWLPYKAA